MKLSQDLINLTRPLGVSMHVDLVSHQSSAEIAEAIEECQDKGYELMVRGNDAIVFSGCLSDGPVAMMRPFVRIAFDRLHCVLLANAAATHFAVHSDRNDGCYADLSSDEVIELAQTMDLDELKGHARDVIKKYGAR